MPVIIDEIVVTVEVTGDNRQETGGGNMDAREKQELIALCVEKVMEILNQKNER